VAAETNNTVVNPAVNETVIIMPQMKQEIKSNLPQQIVIQDNAQALPMGQGLIRVSGAAELPTVLPVGSVPGFNLLNLKPQTLITMPQPVSKLSPSQPVCQVPNIINFAPNSKQLGVLTGPNTLAMVQKLLNVQKGPDIIATTKS